MRDRFHKFFLIGTLRRRLIVKFTLHACANDKVAQPKVFRESAPVRSGFADVPCFLSAFDTYLDGCASVPVVRCVTEKFCER